MTIEAKKTFALIGCAMAAMVVVAGNILMALQIKNQGAGFYVGYLCYSVPVIGMAYQYGHASEKVDHVTVATDIEQFETL